MIESRNATTSGTLLGFAESAGNPGAISQVELDTVIERVSTRWKRAEGDVTRLIRADSAAGLPVAVLRAASEQNIPHDEIKGTLNEGHIHLVRENSENIS